MKKLIIVLTALIFIVSGFSQTPEKMSYQAVIRGNGNALVASHTVGIKISILQGSATGTVVYTETQTPSTNANGLVSIEIGSGTGFSSINWANGPYFIKTETDPLGGTSYNISGTSQLLSVPYALDAKKAETVDYNNLTNQPILNISNWNTAYGWGNHATAGYLTSGTEGDGVVGNEVTNVTNTTLIRSGSGTSASPYTIGLNLTNNNTWTASQNFNSSIYFPGSGIWNVDGNVGIGTTSPANKLQIQNGNLVIDRPQSTSILSLGSVAGITGRIFAGDEGGGSLNTNYNQIKLTANPANTEELLRLHTGADAMSNTGTAALYFGQFNLADMAAIKAINEGGQPLNRTAGLSFWTEPAGTGVPLQERMRISGNGNVGIGTLTPLNKLDVNGVISATGGNSTFWNTAYSWGNHSGLYKPVSYVPDWVELTNKPNFALIATSGNFADLLLKPTTLAGYGITDGMSSLHAANSITDGLISNWNSAYAWGNHAAAGYFKDGGEAGGANRILGNTDNYSLSFLTSNSNRLFISNSGNIGIGTIVPSQSLEVAGIAQVDGQLYSPYFNSLPATGNGNNVAIQAGKANGGFGSTLQGYGGSQNGGNVTIEGGSANHFGQGGNVEIIAGDAFDTNSKGGNILLKAQGYNQWTLGYIAFYTGGSYPMDVYKPLERMRLAGNGNLGLGTTTPAAKVDIIGNIKITDGTQGSGKVLTSDANGAASWQSQNSGLQHYIGELFGGGIIVAIWKVSGSEHGLIASLTDLSSGIIWTTSSYQSTTVPVSGALSPIDGLANSNAIVAQAGTGNTYAAGLCRAFSATGDGGLLDWYLPAVWELNQSYNAAFIVNTILGAANGFQLSPYWSSTENASTNAFYQHFSLGSANSSTKNTNTCSVRAVRRF